MKKLMFVTSVAALVFSFIGTGNAFIFGNGLIFNDTGVISGPVAGLLLGVGIVGIVFSRGYKK